MAAPITLPCGLEVRGLLASALVRCVSSPHDFGWAVGWAVSITVLVPSSQRPADGRTLEVEFHKRYGSADLASRDDGMSQEQRAVALALRELWDHEFAEALWLPS